MKAKLWIKFKFGAELAALCNARGHILAPAGLRSSRKPWKIGGKKGGKRKIIRQLKKKAELECLDHSSPGRNSIKRGLLLLFLLSMGYILTEKDLSRWKVSVFPPGEGMADI